MENVSFSDIAIVSCGTLSLELNYLKQTGVLDTDHLYFTTPGLHEDIHELERQLIRRIEAAKEKTDKVLVVYGGKFCYVNADEPARSMQRIIAEQGPNVARIEATHCMDMIASEAEREEIAREVADGEKVWWMTPGWIQFRRKVFRGWDKGLANENFPRHTWGGHRAGRHRLHGPLHGGKAGGVSRIRRLDGNSHNALFGHSRPFQIAARRSGTATVQPIRHSLITIGCLRQSRPPIFIPKKGGDHVRPHL
jgi:hypothetical protein